MNTETSTIDGIVARVLSRLAADGRGAPPVVVSDRKTAPIVNAGACSITAKVITAEVLLESLRGELRIEVPERAIVTPAARDVAREKGVEIVRGSPRPTLRRSELPESNGIGENQPTGGTHVALFVDLLPLLLVVKSTGGIEQLRDDLQQSWRHELLGCPDEAAALATSALCRGEAETVVVFAEQTHRVACLANRNDRVKAVAVADVTDARQVKQQLRANVWCVDPAGRSYFELRNLMRAVQAS